MPDGFDSYECYCIGDYFGMHCEISYTEGKCNENRHVRLAPLSKTIRIHHECEGNIEKSALMITDWHHEACQVMASNLRKMGIKAL